MAILLEDFEEISDMKSIIYSEKLRAEINLSMVLNMTGTPPIGRNCLGSVLFIRCPLPPAEIITVFLMAIKSKKTKRQKI